MIKGKSDPYGVLRVGTKLFKSKVIRETVNPKWNEVYEVGEQVLARLYYVLRHESESVKINVKNSLLCLNIIMFGRHLVLQ